MVFRLRNLGLALALAAVAGSAWAQGSQTGTLTGRVDSTDGQPLPGVTVSVSAPSLQGERTVVTTANGDYIFKGLPTGRYKVSFTLSGFSTGERTTTVEIAQSSTVNATLSVASVQETVVVTADAPSALETTQTGATLSARDVDTLATGRVLEQIADLAPGLTDNTPNAGQVTIAGGFAYDNVFMIDGVDITDSTFGSAERRVHRGRDRGDAGPDHRRLRGVRPLRRRRHQRHHQEGRQRVLRAASAPTSATRPGATRPRSRTNRTRRARAS